MGNNNGGDVESQPVATGTSSVVPPTRDQMGPPPSYDSIYGKLKAERQKTSNHSTFIANSFTIIGQSIGFTVFLAATLVLPLVMIVVGAINVNNCPVQRYIPIWMIVAGCTSGLLQLLNICLKYKKSRQSDHDDLDGTESGTAANGGSNGILGCFNFAWFIAGNVWVFSVHGKVQHVVAGLSTYCDPITYNLAFWSILAAYIMIGLVCFCGCCVCAALGRETTHD